MRASQLCARIFPVCRSIVPFSTFNKYGSASKHCGSPDRNAVQRAGQNCDILEAATPAERNCERQQPLRSSRLATQLANSAIESVYSPTDRGTASSSSRRHRRPSHTSQPPAPEQYRIRSPYRSQIDEPHQVRRTTGRDFELPSALRGAMLWVHRTVYCIIDAFKQSRVLCPLVAHTAPCPPERRSSNSSDRITVAAHSQLRATPFAGAVAFRRNARESPTVRRSRWLMPTRRRLARRGRAPDRQNRLRAAGV